MRIHRAFRSVSVGLVVAGLIATEPAPATAQSSTSIGIWGGAYTPLGKQVDLGQIGGTVQRNNSFAGGGRLTLWGKTLMGLEAVAGISPAHVDVAGATVNGQRSLNVFAGGVKLMLGVSPAVSPFGLYLGAGPAIVRRGNDVTTQSGSKTALGGVVSVGLRFPVSGGLGLRADAENYIYKGDIGGQSGTRNDLMLSAGLSLGL
jgi:hypothetical protein